MHTRCVVTMRCSCCGRWTVEEITVAVPRYGERQRLRVRQVGNRQGDYANPLEVAAVLERAGVLDKMVDVPTG